MHTSDNSAGTVRASTRLSALDLQTRQFLTLARLFQDEFANPGRQAWMAAFVYAEEHFADRGGARLAYGVLAAVQALRQCRPVDFTYRRASCPCCSQTLTADEALLVAAFAAVQGGDTVALGRWLTRLAYGPDHSGLDTILLLLAQDFAGATRPAACDPAL
jgi:hypothetical protein